MIAKFLAETVSDHLSDKLMLPNVQMGDITSSNTVVEWGENADTSNWERGLLSLPVELTTEILDYFPTIGLYTAAYFREYNLNPVLPEVFLVRLGVLRALSQVCIDYRRRFLPLLWDSLNLYLPMRKTDITGWPNSSFYYDHVAQALVGKCDGLLANPNLASYVG